MCYGNSVLFAVAAAREQILVFILFFFEEVYIYSTIFFIVSNVSRKGREVLGLRSHFSSGGSSSLVV